MQRNTVQYAVVPRNAFSPGYIATELGVQMFLSVADRRDPVEARARKAQIEAAMGWPVGSTLLIDRGAV